MSNLSCFTIPPVLPVASNKEELRSRLILKEGGGANHENEGWGGGGEQTIKGKEGGEQTMKLKEGGRANHEIEGGGESKP